VAYGGKRPTASSLRRGRHGRQEVKGETATLPDENRALKRKRLKKQRARERIENEGKTEKPNFLPEMVDSNGTVITEVRSER